MSRLHKGIWWFCAALNLLNCGVWAIVLHSLKYALVYGTFSVVCVAIALNLFNLSPIDKK